MNQVLFHEKNRNPYYIVSNRYTRTSAGIKTLHLLCHALNSIGERAFLMVYPYHPSDYSVNPDLLTPLLNQKIIDYHFQRSLTPILIYPETIVGNPFHAPFVVRYLLNFPGLLGGNAGFQENEFCISYSNKLGETVPNNQMTLFIPTSDPAIFTPEPRSKRKGTCFYAAKYQDVHNGKLFPITKNSYEITRDKPDSLTPIEIASIFRRSELFYCYENTALAIEAILCECPVVFLPNPYLTESIGSKEMGWDGIAWGTNPLEIDKARKTVKIGRENYIKLFKDFNDQLLYFVEKTQFSINGIPYHKKIKIPKHLNRNFFYPINSIIALISLFNFTRKNLGINYTIKRSIRRILKKGFKINLDRID